MLNFVITPSLHHILQLTWCNTWCKPITPVNRCYTWCNTRCNLGVCGFLDGDPVGKLGKAVAKCVHGSGRVVLPIYRLHAMVEEKGRPTVRHRLGRFDYGRMVPCCLSLIREGRCLVGQVVGFSFSGFGLHLRFGMSLVPDCVDKTGSAIGCSQRESYCRLTTTVRRL